MGVKGIQLKNLEIKAKEKCYFSYPYRKYIE